MGEWQISSIQDVAEKVAMGPFGSSIKVDTFVPDGIPVISGQHLKGSRLEDNEYNFISLEHANKLANANVKRGDVIFTHAGNIGQAAYIPESSRYERYIISQRQFYLRPDKAKIIPEFLAYYFASPDGQHKLLANASSSGVPSIAQPVTYLRTIEIPLPPLPEQRAIAHILGTLDDKIELNRRMNETLEAMARALFKSWFVDFEPVRAKAEGRDTGLPKEIADLFPDSFEPACRDGHGAGRDSELGEVPKGWRVVQLREITSLITKGTTPTQDQIDTAKFTAPSVNFVRVNAIDEDGAILYDKLISIPDEVHSGVLKRSILQENDILYTIAGTIGRSSVVDKSLLPANTNQAVAIIRPITTIRPTFMALAMLQELFREELHSNIVQAVQANLSLGMLSKARIVLPSASTLDQIFMPIDNLMNCISTNRIESRTLTAQRDALLPKLLSGELRVENLCI